jgi:hypothetical protein
MSRDFSPFISFSEVWQIRSDFAFKAFGEVVYGAERFDDGTRHDYILMSEVEYWCHASVGRQMLKRLAG